MTTKLAQDHDIVKMGYSRLMARDWSSTDQNREFTMALAQIRLDSIPMRCFKDEESQREPNVEMVNIYVPKGDLRAARQILRDNGYKHEHPDQMKFDFF